MRIVGIYLFVLTILMANLSFSQDNCGFEGWQLEYFAFAKPKEAFDFLTSNGWEATLEQKRDGYWKLSKNFFKDEGKIYVYKEESDVNLVLMNLPKACWENLKQGFDLVEGENIFFGDKTELVKLEQDGRKGYMEFQEVNGNFTVQVYNEDLKKTISNFKGYEIEINKASGEIVAGNYENAIPTISKSLEYLSNISDDLFFRSKIIPSFFGYGYLNFKDLKMDELGSPFFGFKSSFSLFSVHRVKDQLEKIVKIIHGFKDYQTNNAGTRVYFPNYLSMVKEKEIQQIENEIEGLINSNITLIWTLHSNPNDYYSSYTSRNDLRKYKGVFQIKNYGELEPMWVVDSNKEILFDQFVVKKGKRYVQFWVLEEYDDILVDIGKAIYNNSISFEVID